MAFVPLKPEHAIQEVVIGMSLNRFMTNTELDSIENAHDAWRERLPGKNKFQLIPATNQNFINFGGITGSGLYFERYFPDGSLSWRLKAEGNALAINCLDYSKWAEIWPQIKDLLLTAFQADYMSNDLLVTSCVYTIIDVFKWVGDLTDYDAGQLIDRGGLLVSQSIFDHGPLWHLYQGWYEGGDGEFVRRILKRVHIDSVEQDGVEHISRFETFLQKELFEPTELPVVLGSLDDIYPHLHDMGKEILKSILTTDAKKMIGLE